MLSREWATAPTDMCVPRPETSDAVSTLLTRPSPSAAAAASLLSARFPHAPHLDEVRITLQFSAPVFLACPAPVVADESPGNRNDPKAQRQALPSGSSSSPRPDASRAAQARLSRVARETVRLSVRGAQRSAAFESGAGTRWVSFRALPEALARLGIVLPSAAATTTRDTVFSATNVLGQGFFRQREITSALEWRGQPSRAASKQRDLLASVCGDSGSDDGSSLAGGLRFVDAFGMPVSDSVSPRVSDDAADDARSSVAVEWADVTAPRSLGAPSFEPIATPATSMQSQLEPRVCWLARGF